MRGEHSESSVAPASEVADQLLDAALDAVVTSDAEGRVTGWNLEATRVFGYTRAEVLGRPLAELIVPPEHRERHREGIRRFRETENATLIGRRVEITGQRKSGTVFPIELTLATTKTGGEHRFCAFIRDISERKKAEADLRVAAIAFETQEGMLVTDSRQVILKVNEAFTRITGYSAEEAVGRTPAIKHSGLQDERFYQTLWGSLAKEHAWRGEIWNRRKNGEVYLERLSITAVRDAEGVITNYVASFADITEQRRAEESIHRLAFHDTLTGLANRRLLIDRLQRAIDDAERLQVHGAVLLMDLDHFKELNDTKGHDVGDRLLTEVARRLQSSVRAADTVARTGGDEFVVLLESLDADPVEAARHAERIADKLLLEVNRPVDLGSFVHHISPSLGISVFGRCRGTADDALKRADAAMYEAKRSGRNAVRFFDPATSAAMEARVALVTDLHKAVARRELRPYYQAQVDRRRQIVGAEVLLRWQHPARGLVSPAQFIPLAEETRLILPIGQWVLESTCAQLREWAEDPGVLDLRLSVNVSARQFRQHDFVDQVTRALEFSGARPDRLELELTESLVLEDVAGTIAKMNALKAIGVHFAMDDFGTGYSSLAYLTQLPLDQLKIDRSFVQNIGLKVHDGLIAQTIVSMATSMGLEVIAEGVETEEQFEFLARHGCTMFQGYLFGRPVTLDEFVDAAAQPRVPRRERASGAPRPLGQT